MNIAGIINAGKALSQKGSEVGVLLGDDDGKIDGIKLGLEDGTMVGRILGVVLGMILGLALGKEDGMLDGLKLGVALGIELKSHCGTVNENSNCFSDISTPSITSVAPLKVGSRLT